jgi:transcription-repair coupling factor (superfamily II helicase)
VTDLKRVAAELAKGGSLTLSSVADGFDAFCAGDLTRALAQDAASRAVALVHVARDGQRARAFGEALAFAAPDIELLDFPAWDCQPYDRVSPTPRYRRADRGSRGLPVRAPHWSARGSLSTTVNALVHRVAPLKQIAGDTFSAAPGNVVDRDALVNWLETNGFARASSVRDIGEYAVRGGILDLFPPGMPRPLRLDFFGDALESIRAFDPETQRTTGQLRALDLVPMSEVRLTSESMRRFRQAYVAHFGAQTRGDGLYEAVSEGRRHQGLEHWLPLFYEKLDTLFDYCPGAPLILSTCRSAASEAFRANRKGPARGRPLTPFPIIRLIAAAAQRPLSQGVLGEAHPRGKRRSVSPFAQPESSKLAVVPEARPAFAAERAGSNANVFRPPSAMRGAASPGASGLSSPPGRTARASGSPMSSPTTALPTRRQCPRLRKPSRFRQPHWPWRSLASSKVSRRPISRLSANRISWATGCSVAAASRAAPRIS